MRSIWSSRRLGQCRAINGVEFAFVSVALASFVVLVTAVSWLLLG
jgi:hypothetical protein